MVKIHSRYELGFKINHIVPVLKKPQHFVAIFPRYSWMQQVIVSHYFQILLDSALRTEITVSSFYLEMNASELLSISITTAGILWTALCFDPLQSLHKNRTIDFFFFLIRKLMNLFCVHRFLMLVLDKINVMVFYKMQ